jgi:hypothetical protein
MGTILVTRPSLDNYLHDRMRTGVHTSHHPKSFSGQYYTFYISCKNVKEGKNCSSNLYLTVMRWHWHQYSQFYAENFLGWGAPKSSQQSTPVVINAQQVKGTRLPKFKLIMSKFIEPWKNQEFCLNLQNTVDSRTAATHTGVSLGSKLHSISKLAS